MPHVVVEGPVDLDALRREFEPIFERQGDDVLKIELLYIEARGREALLDALVVESGHRQRFFIQLLPRGGGVTVRLLPHTDPEKTDGVKRALARAARFVVEAEPGSRRYGATNIADFLDPTET